jgi:hypothetical protein
MFEILIERPRLGGGYARPGRPPRDPDDWPRREPMRRHGKMLNENLAPLRRFLERRLGRDWNDVHREISATLSLRSAVQKHVLDHLRMIVDCDVILVDGRPHHAAARNGKSYPVRELYVCPRTRRLMRVAPEPKRPRRRRSPERVALGDGRQAWLIDGIWYAIEFAWLPPRDERRGLRDVVARRSLTDPAIEHELGRRYGRNDIYARQKRQLSKAELRSLGARN